ncbi:MAG: HAD family hydrolase [Promethearchaeota archaeon]
MGEQKARFKLTRAVLFDMHKTITQVNDSFIGLNRKVAYSAGIDLSKFTDDDIRTAHEKFDKWFTLYQIERDVDIHFGNEVEHWTDANRVMFEALGIEGLTDEVLVAIEMEWKGHLKTWETIRPDGKDTIIELHNRGYQIGICTRRTDDPTNLLREWGILDYLDTVQWTAVPGYAKPNPFTLILASEEIGVNPLRCVYVGNRADIDVEAAMRAGMVPILTTWADKEEAKKAPQGTYVIGEVSELLGLFPK